MTNARQKFIKARDARVREIYQRDGRLDPQALVEDAKNRDSPLHSWFEWDDRKAAHAYRIRQARQIIREVRIQVEYTTHAVSAPVYVQDTREQRGYVSVEDLKSDEQHAREALGRRLNAVYSAAVANRYLAEELGIADEFDAFVAQVERLRVMVGAA